jgi:hypothetical protein
MKNYVVRLCAWFPETCKFALQQLIVCANVKGLTEGALLP